MDKVRDAPRYALYKSEYVLCRRRDAPLGQLLCVGPEHEMGYAKRMSKTYNSGDSLVVTHLTTNPPVHCLYMAERTGSLIFSVLWSYVKGIVVIEIDKAGTIWSHS
jgi:hypothetical protein